MRPPRIAERMLELVAPPAVADGLIGDLNEEFRSICLVRGEVAARRWYLSQAARSLLPILRLRAAEEELPAALAVHVGLIAIPLLLLDRLWVFVYTQIPLRGGPERSGICSG